MTESTVVERTAALPRQGTWVVDKLHSRASFEVSHALATFSGSFRELEGRLEVDGDEPRLTGSVEVASIDIDDEQLKPHLLSPDFFDAERTPEVRFSSTSIEQDGDELVVRGELEIRGNTVEVSARGTATEPVEFPGGAEKIGLALRAGIDRTDYGLDWNMELPGGGKVLGDAVTLIVSLELLREA